MSDEKQQSPKEQGFNDSELQDIMEEIEGLEKEFSGNASSDEDNDSSDLQKAIDREVEELGMQEPHDKAEDEDDDEDEEGQDDVFNESDFDDDSHTEVTAISSQRPPHSHHDEVQLKASGAMNLELSFPVGEHKADFKVLRDGFCVEFNGMLVHIDEKEGCHISMPNGGEFSLPLGPNKVKKAS